MSKANCGWLEEEVVDLAMGKLPVEKERELQSHMQQCERCTSVYRDWQLILGDSQVLMMPSPVLKKRLMRKVSILSTLASFKHRLRPLIIVPAAATALLLLLASGLLSGDRAIPETAQLAKAEILKQNAMVNHPKTVLHQVVPVVRTDIRGYVWINDSSNEMLLLAEGLDRLAEKDYQVWFVIGNNRSNVGVLQWRGRMAHLYVHSREIRQVDDIAVSIEPKGGSYAPTGPDAMIVKIRHESE
jgi:hypothetical protein